MNIILGNDRLSDLEERYILLPLDQFRIEGYDDPVPSYCLIENIPIEELPFTPSWRELHENLVSNFAKRHWDYCEDAISHLMGKWNGELDSFYIDLGRRIKSLKEQQLDDDWSPVINR